MKTEMHEISPKLKKAIIFKEDKYFYYHFGINPLAIIRAAYNNSIQNKRTSGASTITMQVARLLSPKKRTYWNKIKEMFRALQLELKYSKDEILQMYLNIVPYGSNIEGVKAASILYLNKSPDHLSIAEIAALSIIPNRPNSLKIGVNNGVIIIERNRWLERYRDAGLFGDHDISDALEEPFDAERTEAPKLAPHFSYRMKHLLPNQPIIRTNLNIQTQLKTEQLVKKYINQLYINNIKKSLEKNGF
jgi:penicillin-binding protein 1C